MKRSESCDKAFLSTLIDLAESGISCAGAKNSGALATVARTSRPTKETLAYSRVIDNPRDRVVNNTTKKLDLPVAVARFIWMMSASDRLADIAFYEPRVKAFSDDGISVPGSSYGRRIRQSQPGIDQLAGAINRLKEDGAGGRRAAISIYQPTDTTRESNDIPCAFGLMYHGREGVLHSTTIMRSNNAVGLLPFNLFEFSMLAEAVAVEAGLKLGPMYHFAGSMHFYEEEFEKLKVAPQDAKSTPVGEMPKMPAAPLEQIRLLVMLEAGMRQESENVRAPFIDEWRTRVQKALVPYWQQFAYLLLIQIAKRNQDATAFNGFKALLEAYYSQLVPDFSISSAAAGQSAVSAAEQLFKPGPPADAVPAPNRDAIRGRVVQLCRAYEQNSGHPLGAKVAFDVLDEFQNRLAARKTDGEVISQSEFDDALNRHLQAAGLESVATKSHVTPKRPRKKT